MRAKAFLARRVCGVFIYVHTAAAPTDEEWDVVLKYYRDAVDLQQYRALVYTDGGAPNASQRARLNQQIGDKKSRIAVLTASGLARAAGIAIGWFKPGMRVYAPDELDKALDHLEVHDDDRTILRHSLIELKRTLGLAGS